MKPIHRPRSVPGAIAIGVRAALRAPRHVRGDLCSLLEAREGAAPPSEHIDLSLRTARRGVRALALLPGSPWRNTCLFRSVAECLALREHGVAARLRLGVRGGRGSEPGAAGGIDAHAWVEWEGTDERNSGDGFTPIVAGSNRGYDQRPGAGPPAATGNG